tara:strand:+ start:1408 stop:1527 length:120 start_codon:yes stop_codon:yes gene_type:complete
MSEGHAKFLNLPLKAATLNLGNPEGTLSKGEAGRERGVI